MRDLLTWLTDFGAVPLRGISISAGTRETSDLIIVRDDSGKKSPGGAAGGNRRDEIRSSFVLKFYLS